jgi:ethanolamine utilization protein EutN
LRFARVVGTTVSTAKDAGLVGRKLLLCVRCDARGRDTADEQFVAVDTVGAGVGEVVLVVLGSAARVSEAVREAPSDATVVGIVDSIELDGSVTFRKGGRGGDSFD